MRHLMVIGVAGILPGTAFLAPIPFRPVLGNRLGINLEALQRCRSWRFPGEA
jgi:hypothetical protein